MNIHDIKNALNQRITEVKIDTKAGVKEEQIVAAPAPKKAPEAKVNELSPAATIIKEDPAPKATRKPRKTKVESEAQVAAESIDSVVAKVLKPEADYGVIPGCRKPSLYKAGAEKLAAYYGYSTSIEVVNRYENYDKSLVLYEIKVTVFSNDGRIIAEGIGAANSRERKFLRGDFFSQINTVLKIAKKRAYVDAVLTATGSSSLFTQDMEDIALGDNNNHRMESVG